MLATHKGYRMAGNGWPSFARPIGDDEMPTLRLMQRMEWQHDTLRADVVLLISALQQIEYHTTDERAKRCAQFALKDYEKARKEAEKKYKAMEAKHNNG